MLLRCGSIAPHVGADASPLATTILDRGFFSKLTSSAADLIGVPFENRNLINQKRRRNASGSGRETGQPAMSAVSLMGHSRWCRDAGDRSVQPLTPVDVIASAH